MKMESIDLVELEMSIKDVQDEGTEIPHGVQEYMKKKKKKILQRVAEEGTCRIRSMWTNLATLQPMLNDILNEMPMRSTYRRPIIIERIRMKPSIPHRSMIENIITAL